MSLAFEGWQAAERFAAGVAERFSEHDQHACWDELRNRLYAFGRFLYAEIALEPRAASSLEGQLRATACLDPYDRLWVTEGLGYAHGGRLTHHDAPMLRGRSLPTGTLIPLHTGMGLALAAAVFEDDPEGPTVARVGEFVNLCTRHAASGYASVTFEALGLVTRALTPHLMRRVARDIAALHPGLEAYFWHGVGRGTYFSPLLAATLAPSRDLLTSALAAAPPGESTANVLAGLSWAVVLVNIRDPEVIERFIGACDSDGRSLNAVGDGIGRAIQVWAACIGADDRLRALADWVPAQHADRWRRLVATPCRGLLDGIAVDRPARWFRYRSCDGNFVSRGALA